MYNKQGNGFMAMGVHFLAIVFSILFDASFGFSIRFGYAIAIYLLLISVAARKYLFISLITVLCILSSLYAPVSFLYGSPNINILLSITASNFSESAEFLLAIPISYYLFSLSIIIISIILVCKANLLSVKHKKLTLLIFMTIVFTRPMLSVAKGEQVEIDFTPVKFINKFYRAAVTVDEENRRINALIKLKSTLLPTPASDKFDTYILVIGESVRRDFMGAYGFPIDNTPFISRAKGIIFDNYISAASSTQTSLLTSFTSPGKPQNNLVQLAQEQGLHTWWISNQGSRGNDDSQVSLIGRQANKPIFIKKGEYNTAHHDDMELLPYIHAALQDKPKNKLIIVHLMGSHATFCTRTGNKYDKFYINKSLSCYVQSIKNTDRLLADITVLANKENKKWTMMYFSDHGLSFINTDDKKPVTLMHGDKTKQNFSAPLFITSYDAEQRIVKKSPYSGMDFLSLYLYWTGSSEPSIYQTCNPIDANECKSSDIQVFDFDLKPKAFSSLIDEPISSFIH